MIDRVGIVKKKRKWRGFEGKKRERGKGRRESDKK